MGIIRRFPFQRKAQSVKGFTQQLPSMIHAVETEWRRRARLKPKGLYIDTKQQSLLRVAHHSLASLLELSHEDEQGAWR